MIIGTIAFRGLFFIFRHSVCKKAWPACMRVDFAPLLGESLIRVPILAVRLAGILPTRHITTAKFAFSATARCPTACAVVSKPAAYPKLPAEAICLKGGSEVSWTCKEEGRVIICKTDNCGGWEERRRCVEGEEGPDSSLGRICVRLGGDFTPWVPVQERKECEDGGQGDNAETNKDEVVGTHIEVKHRLALCVQKLDMGSLSYHGAAK